MNVKTPSGSKEHSKPVVRKVSPLTLQVAALLTSAVAGYFIWLYAIVDKERQQLDLLAQKNLLYQQQVIQNYLTSVVEKTMQYSRSDGLSSGLLSPDFDTLSDYRYKLMEDIANLESVRFFSLNQTQIEPADTPLNFITMDMINRSERGQVVHPELVRDKKENRWFLAIVAPIYHRLSNSEVSQLSSLARLDSVIKEKTQTQGGDEAQIIGVMYLSVSLEGLMTQLSSLDRTLGRTDLSQQVADKKFTTVFTVGHGDSYPVQQMTLANGHWRLSYTPSEILYQQVRQARTLVILIIACVTLLLMIFCWFVTRLINHRLATVTSSTIAEDAAIKQPDKKIVSTVKSTQDTDSLLDIELAEEDQLLLHGNSTEEEIQVIDQGHKRDVPDTIFRAYDIRGIVDEQLTCELAVEIGQAFASEVLEKGDKAIFIGRDGRTHSPKIAEAFARGVLSTGCDVINLGLVPTPLMNFATSIGKKTNSGAMVTASHNPKNYNGFKFVAKGRTLLDRDIQAIKTSIASGNFHKGQGKIQSLDISRHYIERILSDIALVNSLHVVIDAANGATSIIAPMLFEELGCKVTRLFCEVDGHFPNHDPDPSVIENLGPLIDSVKREQADIGFAFDGDGDRLVVVTPQGRVVWPDQLMMLFAEDIVCRNPGCDVIYDVKSTRQLAQIITQCGGRPIMWKTGHANMKTKMRETGALLAGEFSGHIFFKERWFGFDDGMYAAARLLEIVTLGDRDIDDIFEEFHPLITTPEIKIPVGETEKFTIIESLIKNASFANGSKSTIDGVRVDFPRSWGLIRASNTTASLTLRFEAETEEDMEKIKRLFRLELSKLNAKLPVTF